MKNKFRMVSNPFGVIFHPLAQFQLLSMALKEQMPAENSYVLNQGIWYNYLFHSSFSDTSRENLEDRIAKKFEQLNSQIAELDILFFTFGTAIQYQHLSSGLIVANCHKVPQKEFKKSLTPLELIISSFNSLLSANPNFKPQIILSVSPVRHLSEGIESNSVSKAALRLVCQQLTQSAGKVHYFPGFEIMMDDLRDYRFYENDMIHPNETARAYIWDLFIENYLDNGARNFVREWEKIVRSIKHRPFHPHSDAHQEFIKKTLMRIEQLPGSIDTTDEVAQLKKNLI